MIDFGCFHMLKIGCGLQLMFCRCDGRDSNVHSSLSFSEFQSICVVSSGNVTRASSALSGRSPVADQRNRLAGTAGG